MQLHAAFVPPNEVLQDVLDAARRIDLLPMQPTEAPRTGRLQRLLRRETRASPSPDPLPGLVPSEEAFVRLARFGNVTVDDAQSLAVALGAAAQTWPVPVVHVVGLVMDVTAPRPVITAQLGGDIDEMSAVFARFHEVARRQRFFLDRRSFRPEFAVAAVDISQDSSLRDRMRFESQDHRGPDWQASTISMLRMYFGTTSGSFGEVAVVPVGREGS